MDEGGEYMHKRGTSEYLYELTNGEGDGDGDGDGEGGQASIDLARDVPGQSGSPTPLQNRSPGEGMEGEGVGGDWGGRDDDMRSSVSSAASFTISKRSLLWSTEDVMESRDVHSRTDLSVSLLKHSTTNARPNGMDTVSTRVSDVKIRYSPEHEQGFSRPGTGYTAIPVSPLPSGIPVYRGGRSDSRGPPVGLVSSLVKTVMVEDSLVKTVKVSPEKKNLRVGGDGNHGNPRVFQQHAAPLKESSLHEQEQPFIDEVTPFVGIPSDQVL